MGDITPRLKSVKEGIAKLAAMATGEQAEAARELAADLHVELDRAMQEAAPTPAGAAPSRADLPRPPRNREEKCPRCTLRAFTFQEGTIRERADAEGKFEALYHCMSCGHEAWRKLD